MQPITGGGPWACWQWTHWLRKKQKDVNHSLRTKCPLAYRSPKRTFLGIPPKHCVAKDSEMWTNPYVPEHRTIHFQQPSLMWDGILLRWPEMPNCKMHALSSRVVATLTHVPGTSATVSVYVIWPSSTLSNLRLELCGVICYECIWRIRSNFWNILNTSQISSSQHVSTTPLSNSELLLHSNQEDGQVTCTYRYTLPSQRRWSVPCVCVCQSTCIIVWPARLITLFNPDRQRHSLVES